MLGCGFAYLSTTSGKRFIYVGGLTWIAAFYTSVLVLVLTGSASTALETVFVRARSHLPPSRAPLWMLPHKCAIFVLI
jgi:hypothetical protein